MSRSKRISREPRIVREWEYRRTHPSKLGLAALSFARAEIGEGETTGQNAGPRIDHYRNMTAYRKRRFWPNRSWCARFVSFVFLRASQRLGLSKIPFEWSGGARRLYRNAVASGGLIIDFEDIQPGDIMLFKRGPLKPRNWWRHIAICSRVKRKEEAVAYVDFIDGNSGPFPSRVKERRLTPNRCKKLCGIVRVH